MGRGKEEEEDAKTVVGKQVYCVVVCLFFFVLLLFCFFFCCCCCCFSVAFAEKQREKKSKDHQLKRDQARTFSFSISAWAGCLFLPRA